MADTKQPDAQVHNSPKPLAPVRAVRFKEIDKGVLRAYVVEPRYAELGTLVKVGLVTTFTPEHYHITAGQLREIAAEMEK